MNRGDMQCGWDTDQFPNNIPETALAMYLILKGGDSGPAAVPGDPVRWGCVMGTAGGGNGTVNDAFRAVFAEGHAAQALVALRYVDGQGQPTEVYPHNPNGSPHGVTGLTTADGRFTIMMPHPERVFRTVQNSWHPSQWAENGAWYRMFANARRWVG